MPSIRQTALTRWWTRRGAIRLEEDECTEKEELPLYQDLEGESEEKYTRYLYLFPSFDPITNEILRPRWVFIYILLALVSIPLVLGILAGAKALMGEEERAEREERGKSAKFGEVAGFTLCCAGIWAIVAFVVREQTLWLQLDLAFTTLCAQALVIRGATGHLVDSNNEDSTEKLNVHEFLRETTIVQVYEDCQIPFYVERSAPLP
ncbi:hypothetical protein JCM5353_002463 [Sporobolomyces roseus]